MSIETRKKKNNLKNIIEHKSEHNCCKIIFSDHTKYSVYINHDIIKYIYHYILDVTPVLTLITKISFK